MPEPGEVEASIALGLQGQSSETLSQNRKKEEKGKEKNPVEHS